MLYLEGPAPHTFTAARVEMMELLAVQAAISLRHTDFVTDLRHAEQAARRSAEELQLIIEGIPELIWRADAESGALLRKLDLGGEITSGPAVVNDMVFVGVGLGPTGESQGVYGLALRGRHTPRGR